MTAPDRPTTSAAVARSLVPAPPPNPKIQAVTFALELAKIRATSEVGGDKSTDVAKLIGDADAIATFIGGVVS